jgi:hypothetical protein
VHHRGLTLRKTLSLKFERCAATRLTIVREFVKEGGTPCGAGASLLSLDLLLGLLVFLLLLESELLLSSHALNPVGWLGRRHLHNTCASVKCHSFPVKHDSSCMMHHENNSLDKKLCCQQRKQHAQAQAQTALSAISENRDFSNIPARRGTMGAFTRAPLFCLLATPKRGV